MINEAYGLGAMAKVLLILRKRETSFVKPNLFSKAPSSCLGAQQICVKRWNPTGAFQAEACQK